MSRRFRNAFAQLLDSLERNIEADRVREGGEVVEGPVPAGWDASDGDAATIGVSGA